MPNNPNAAKNLKPFKKGQIANPNGRPKKYVSAVLDELRNEGIQNVTKGNIVDIYESLLALSEAKLKDMLNDKEIPMIYRIIAKNMLSAKGFDVVEKMLDRTHGKAVGKHEIEINQTDTRKEERYAKFLDEPSKYIPNDSPKTST